MSSEERVKIEAFPHHIRQKVCGTRSPYRRGRKERAVKVFTISDESKYLLIQRVPDFKCDIKQELRKLCQRYGPIERLDLTDYPNCEEFTNTYLVKYKIFVNAIRAKKTLDDHNFLGSILHVCYAPELETIDETREKLDLRKRYLPRSVDNKQPVLQRSEPKVVEEVQSVDHKSSDQSSHQILDNKNTNFKRKFSQISDDLTEVQTQTQRKSEEPNVTPKIRWRTKT